MTLSLYDHLYNTKHAYNVNLKVKRKLQQTVLKQTKNNYLKFKFSKFFWKMYNSAHGNLDGRWLFSAIVF